MLFHPPAVPEKVNNILSLCEKAYTLSSPAGGAYLHDATVVHGYFE
jgi:hypothetical protein